MIPEYRQQNKIFEPVCDKCPTKTVKAIGGYSLDGTQLKQRMNKVFDGILLVPGTPRENWGGLEKFIVLMKRLKINLIGI